MPPTNLSCPACGARAAVHADACAACGYRFVERVARRRRVPRAALGVALAAVAAVGVAALLATRDAANAPARPSPSSAVLSTHPLSTRAAERRLEERFASAQDDDTAAARCSPLEPRPAHAIRHCRIRYPGGAERTVVVLTNPRGRELLVDP